MMTSLLTFLDMGGYAAFVWSAFGMGLLIMTFMWIIPVLEMKKTHEKLNRYYLSKKIINNTKSRS